MILCPLDLIGAAPYVRAASYAGVLVQNGVEVKVIEPAAEKKTIKQISAVIKSFSPQIILLGVFPSTLPDTYQTIQMIRREFPVIKVVVEGYMINADQNFVKHLSADFGLTGDAEFALAELVKSIFTGSNSYKDQDGIVWLEEGVIKSNKPAMIKHLDDIPFPAYQLMPIGKYYSASTNKRLFILFTARGCPYECNFCANISQGVLRQHSIERVIAEIEYLVNQRKVKYVEFMDFTFTINRKRVLEICDHIIAKGLKFSWACETRVDKVDEVLLKAMKKAGCEKITFGVESGSEKVRNRSNKTISNEDFVKVFDLCRKVGIKTMANFIFGHPKETISEMEASIRFSKKLNPFNVLFTRMIPLPDIEIFDTAVKENVVPKDVWVKYMKGDIELPVYYPENISKSQLNSIYTKAHIQFYLRPKVILDYLPLFTDLNFIFRSVAVFMSMTFGSTKYK